nr:hypothetical protein [Methanosarcina sp. DH1]
MRQIAIYRKGKIGICTTTQNLTAVLATISNKILLVDVVRKQIPPEGCWWLKPEDLCDTLKSEGDEGVHLETVMQPVFGNIKCVES